ncbi:hypothetical protein [Bradyrhizobium sp. sGM-13]|uniref:hypothetical protein n=1 Tax=Bradyrhizobium sp. sGM-13 TaxID=2831781 RepID=UPI0035C7DA26
MRSLADMAREASRSTVRHAMAIEVRDADGHVPGQIHARDSAAQAGHHCKRPQRRGALRPSSQE